MVRFTTFKQSGFPWNPFWGCRHGCMYCIPSFQRQAQRMGKRCPKCASFIPHFHEKRLSNQLPRTPGDKFIFCCSMGDIAFCKSSEIQLIIERIEQLPDKTFLIQSKNPKIFNHYKFPPNVRLGATIETNRSNLYRGIALGDEPPPSPFQRYKAMINLRHKRKVVTIEPIIDFDMDALVKWVSDIEPEICYVGYDSKNNLLPEPEERKVKILIEKLRAIPEVKTKPLIVRKAWWERFLETSLERWKQKERRYFQLKSISI